MPIAPETKEVIRLATKQDLEDLIKKYEKNPRLKPSGNDEHELKRTRTNNGAGLGAKAAEILKR